MAGIHCLEVSSESTGVISSSKRGRSEPAVAFVFFQIVLDFVLFVEVGYLKDDVAEVDTHKDLITKGGVNLLVNRPIEAEHFVLTTSDNLGDVFLVN